MPPTPHRVLITGFGPFPGILDNATAHFAPLLAEHARRQLPMAQVTSAVLPVEWEAAPRLLQQLVAEAQPSICLHLGVTGHSDGISIETYARNAAGCRQDAAGRLPISSRLLADAPLRLFPGANSMRLLAQCRSSRLQVSASLSAGDFLCNAVFFHSLWLVRQQATGRQVAFLHLPVRVGAFGQAVHAVPNAATPLALEFALAVALRVLVLMTRQAPAHTGLEAGLDVRLNSQQTQARCQAGPDFSGRP